MKKETKILVEAVKAHALANQDNSEVWHYVVEYYDDDEMAEDIALARTVKGAIRNIYLLAWGFAAIAESMK